MLNIEEITECLTIIFGETSCNELIIRNILKTAKLRSRANICEAGLLPSGAQITEKSLIKSDSEIPCLHS